MQQKVIVDEVKAILKKTVIRAKEDIETLKRAMEGKTRATDAFKALIREGELTAVFNLYVLEDVLEDVLVNEPKRYVPFIKPKHLIETWLNTLEKERENGKTPDLVKTYQSYIHLMSAGTQELTAEDIFLYLFEMQASDEDFLLLMAIYDKMQVDKVEALAEQRYLRDPKSRFYQDNPALLEGPNPKVLKVLTKWDAISALQFKKTEELPSSNPGTFEISSQEEEKPAAPHSPAAEAPINPGNLDMSSQEEEKHAAPPSSTSSSDAPAQNAPKNSLEKYLLPVNENFINRKLVEEGYGYIKTDFITEQSGSVIQFFAPWKKLTDINDNNRRALANMVMDQGNMVAAFNLVFLNIIEVDFVILIWNRAKELGKHEGMDLVKLINDYCVPAEAKAQGAIASPREVLLSLLAFDTNAQVVLAFCQQYGLTLESIKTFCELRLIENPESEVDIENNNGLRGTIQFLENLIQTQSTAIKPSCAEAPPVRIHTQATETTEASLVPPSSVSFQPPSATDMPELKLADRKTEAQSAVVSSEQKSDAPQFVTPNELALFGYINSSTKPFPEALQEIRTQIMGHLQFYFPNQLKEFFANVALKTKSMQKGFVRSALKYVGNDALNQAHTRIMNIINNLNPNLVPSAKVDFIRNEMKNIPKEIASTYSKFYIQTLEMKGEHLTAEMLRLGDNRHTHDSLAKYYAANGNTDGQTYHEGMERFWRNTCGLIHVRKTLFLSPLAVVAGYSALGDRNELDHIRDFQHICDIIVYLYSTKQEQRAFDLQQQKGITNADLAAILSNTLVVMRTSESYTNEDYAQYSSLATRFMNAYKSNLQLAGLHKVNETIKELEARGPESMRQKAFLCQFQKAVLDIYTRKTPPSENKKVTLNRLIGSVLKSSPDIKELKGLRKELKGYTGAAMFTSKAGKYDELRSLLKTYIESQPPAVAKPKPKLKTREPNHVVTVL